MNLVESDSKAPFSIATTPRYREGLYYFTLDPYFTMLSVKQGGIKCHSLSLWCDSTKDWTPVFQAIVEHSSRLVYGPVVV